MKYFLSFSQQKSLLSLMFTFVFLIGFITKIFFIEYYA